MAFLTYEEIQKSAQLVESDLKKSEAVGGSKVFLSHSSKDDAHVAGVTKFIKKYGGNVYADNGDKRLPKDPSPETAAILRTEIKKAQRFVVMISEQSSTSGWIPWELGFADGDKGYKNVALLPISGKSVEEAWAKREYLGLYPVIRKTAIQNRTGEFWVVQEVGATSVTFLENWLKSESK